MKQQRVWDGEIDEEEGGGAGGGGDRNSSKNVGAAFLGALATAFDINLACVGVAVGVTRLDLGGLGES